MGIKPGDVASIIVVLSRPPRHRRIKRIGGNFWLAQVETPTFESLGLAFGMDLQGMAGNACGMCGFVTACSPLNLSLSLIRQPQPLFDSKGNFFCGCDRDGRRLVGDLKGDRPAATIPR